MKLYSYLYILFGLCTFLKFIKLDVNLSFWCKFVNNYIYIYIHQYVQKLYKKNLSDTKEEMVLFMLCIDMKHLCNCEF